MAIKNYFFIMLFAMLLFVVPGISHGAELSNTSLISTSSLVAYWKMETSTYAIGYNGDIGTISGGSFSNTNSLYGNNFDFYNGGIPQYWDLGTLSGTGFPNGSNVRSFSSWFRPTAQPTSTTNPFLCYGSPSTDSGWCPLYINDSGTYKLLLSNYGDDHSIPITLSLNTWHNLIVTWDGTTEEAWVDGVDIGGYNPTLNTSITQGWIGKQLGGTVGSLLGQVDDFAVFSAVLSPAEIAEINGGGTPSEPNISFILPNASGTSPDFQNWLLNVSTTASSTYGNVKVWYGQSSSSYDFSDQAQFSAFVNINPFPLSKSQLLNPIVSFFSTSTWYAMAEYSGTGFDVTSTQIQFHIDPQALTPNTSSSASVGYFTPLPFTNPSSTGSSSLPYADCGITQIGGCLTNAGLFLANFFFQPNPQVLLSMNANFDHIKGSFPFSAFFNVIDTAKANATTTSGNYDLYLDVASVGIHIPILTSTTLEMAIGSSSKAMVFTTEKNIIWLGTGVAMLSLLLL